MLCFIDSCYSFIQDLRREESKGTEDQRGEATLGEDPENQEEKKNSLCQSYYNKKGNILFYDHVSLAVFFLISPPLCSLLKPFFSTSLLCSISKLSRVACGRSNKSW